MKKRIFYYNFNRTFINKAFIFQTAQVLLIEGISNLPKFLPINIIIISNKHEVLKQLQVHYQK